MLGENTCEASDTADSPEEDLIDFDALRELGKGSLSGVGAELGGLEVLELSAKGAEGGTLGGDHEDVLADAGGRAHFGETRREMSGESKLVMMMALGKVDDRGVSTSDRFTRQAQAGVHSPGNESVRLPAAASVCVVRPSGYSSAL